jgi:hypothetical protein|tara:strand:+ start:596 stop:775 length:180 start_codon:yes stop_codon:yes gene_type:complete
MSNRIKVKKDLLDRVEDGLDYFLGFRMEELKSDDRYYLEAMFEYMEYLEKKVNELTKTK